MYYETEKIELKEKVTDVLVKEIESFLNTDGGVIFIGVSDNGTVVGVDNIDECLRKISDIISDQIEPNAIDCVRPEVVYEGNKLVIKINITKGYNALYCIKKYGFSPNGCHFRVGTTCKTMTFEMIKNLLEKSLSNFDIMIKTPSYYGDISFKKLKLLFLESGYHLEENSYEKNLKLKTLEGKYNYLAELLSDKNMISLIFAKFKGNTKASYSERTDYGNQCIITAYEGMKNRLINENICKTITYPRPRRDIYLYDIDAVNEALVNAIIHNDYRITEPQVSFFDDRLEIISHGGLPFGLSKEQFFDGISKPRNENLTDIFVRLGIVEHTGHGVPTIISKYGKEAFEIFDNYIRVTIPFNTEVLENHGALSGALSGVNNIELNELESKVYEAIKINQNLTAKEISENLYIPFRSVQRYLATLKEKGFIVREGSNKKGYWKIIK